MQDTDKLFKSFDGKEIFYRVWNELKSSNKKALIIVHRGHEHLARMLFYQTICFQMY
jgi:alpha-beta hydrolase superfamily lysophospholipase